MSASGSGAGLGEKITAVPSSGGGNGRVSIRSKLASSAVSCSAAPPGSAAGSGAGASFASGVWIDALNASTIAVSIATVGPWSAAASAGGAGSSVAAGASSPGPSRSTTPETVGT